MLKLIGSWSLLFCLLDLQLEVVLAFSLHRTGFSSSIGGNRLADLPIVSKCVITRRRSDLFSTTEDDYVIVSSFADSDDIETDSFLDGEYFEDSDEDQQGDDDDDDDDDLEEEEERSSYYSYVTDLLSDVISKAIIANERQYISLLNEQRKAEECEQIQYKANLILSNLWQIEGGAKEVTVIDWEKEEEVKLVLDTDKYDSPNEEADALFVQARKMKRGSSVVKDLIAKNEKSKKILLNFDIELKNFQSNFVDNDRLMTESEEISLLSIWQRLFDSSKKTGIKMGNNKPITIEEFEDLNRDCSAAGSSKQGSKRKTKTARDGTTFRHFDSPSGLKVVVGRNRCDNEAICFKVAKGEDIWMHARGCPGAHVLLKVRRGSTKPTDEDLQFCANLAAFYSESRTEHNAVITLAEPKHILKPRGAPPGAVKLRHELGSLIGHPQDVPEELKLAREESGFSSDESGARLKGGKAKSRKRFQANLKEQQQKKRQERRKKKEKHNSPEFYND